jgi:hypothetical protein
MKEGNTANLNWEAMIEEKNAFAVVSFTVFFEEKNFTLLSSSNAFASCFSL